MADKNNIIKAQSRMIESKTDLVKTLMTMVPAFAKSSSPTSQDQGYNFLDRIVWTVQSEYKCECRITRCSILIGPISNPGQDKSLLKSMAIVHPSRKLMVAQKDGTLKCPNLWSYRNAFFFTGTIGTTIGYGNVYPTTNGGKIFCVIYALTSIPLFGFFMGKIGNTLKLYTVACPLSFHFRPPKKWKLKGHLET